MFYEGIADLLSRLAIELRYAAGDCRDPRLYRMFMALADAIDGALAM